MAMKTKVVLAVELDGSSSTNRSGGCNTSGSNSSVNSSSSSNINGLISGGHSKALV